MNLAFAAQKATTELSDTSSISFWSALMEANIFVQLTVLVLIGMSVFSWAIIAFKWKTFKRLEEVNKAFLEKFQNASSLDTLKSESTHFQESNLASVFSLGYKELEHIADSNMNKDSKDPQFLDGMDNLDRTLGKAVDNEIAKIEDKVSFLATIGNSAPFIGLFGTVLGITGSFQKIALYQSASLTVVAPGLSEALYATAIGLFAAIPASIFYNHFLSKIRDQEIELNNFSKDFLNTVKRNFFKGA